MRQSAAEVRIEKLAARYFEIAAEKAALEREEANVRDQLEEWLLDHGEEAIDLEGVGSIEWATRRTYQYDVKAISEFQPHLFRRLLELNVLDISKARLDANKRLIAERVPATEGEIRYLKRDRSKR